jgi:TonB family protein
MGTGLSTGTLVKGTGIGLVFSGITLFAVGIVQRAQVTAQAVPLPSAVPPARVIGKSKKDVPHPRPAPPASVASGAPAPLIHPIPLYRPEPQYSEEARKAKYGGTVHVSVVIDEQGSIQDINILDPPGLGLDEKIIECLHKWKFRPATRGGIPVTEKATIEVTFRLL